VAKKMFPTRTKDSVTYILFSLQIASHRPIFCTEPSKQALKQKRYCNYYIVLNKYNEIRSLPLVHRSSIVAVLNLFTLAFFSTASARGQWKSAFPLAVILEPPVKSAFSLAVFLMKPPVKSAFPLAVFLRKPPVKSAFPLAAD
jgi:hypothetical protein